MLPAYAVQALMHKQGVHPAGRKAGGRRVLKTAVGLTVAAAAVGAAFLLSKIEFPEKHYTLDHYRETSPRMSAAAERFFPDDPKTRLHALEYLDRLDMTQRWDGSMDVEGRRDGIVQKNWTRYQWDDLRSNILDGRYDFEAAEKYNKAYDRQIAETSATLGALVPKSPTVSSKQLGERLRGFKMVHINEEHYNPKHVQYEGDLIEMLAKDKPLRIGMEHFDEDYQDYLDRYFSGEISMKPLLRRMEANMTSDAFIGLSAKLREYEPMFDRLRALNKSGARIRVIAMERGYDEQEVYAPYDFYLRDRHMSERLSSVVQADRAAGVDARYVTVTGKAHAFCPRHLPAWVKSKTGLDSATIVFGDQSFMTDAHEFLIESGRSGGPDQQLKKEILGSNMFYIESSEKGVEVRDLSKAK